MLRLVACALLLCLLAPGGTWAEEQPPAPGPSAEDVGRQLALGDETARRAARNVLRERLSSPDGDDFLDRVLAAYARAAQERRASEPGEAEIPPAAQGAAPSATQDALVPRIYNLEEFARKTGRTPDEVQDWIHNAAQAVRILRDGVRAIVTATEAGHSQALAALALWVPQSAPAAEAPVPTASQRVNGPAAYDEPLDPQGEARSEPVPDGPVLGAFLARIPAVGLDESRLRRGEPLERALEELRGGRLIALSAEEAARQAERLQQLAGARIETLAEALQLSTTQELEHLGPAVPYRRDIASAKGEGYLVTTAAMPSGWRIDRASPQGLRQTPDGMEVDLLVEHVRVRLSATPQRTRAQTAVLLDRPEVEVARRVVSWLIPPQGGGALLDVSLLLDEPGTRAVLLLRARPLAPALPAPEAGLPR